MSFHDQGFWMSKVAGCLNDGDTTYGDSSRIESKRPHQWFMDGPVVDMFPNKKQAVEIPNNNLSSGMFSSNISAWGNSTSFDLFTDQITERLFDPDATRRTMNFENRSISSVVDNLNVGRKDNMDPSGSDPSFGLSITHTLEDPQSGLNYGGIRKVKVSEVKESENVVAVPTTDANDREVNNTLSNPHAYKGDKNSISMSLTYDKGDHNIISVDESYGRTRHNLISMGQSYDKEDDSLSVSQTYKEICNTTSIDQAFSKEDSKMISISQAYKNADDNSMSRDHIFSNGKDGTISVGHTHTYHKGGNYMLSVANSYKKGESSIISFGGCNDNDTPPCRLISSYELLMGQPPSLKSEAVDEKEMVKYNSDLLLTTAQTSAYRTDFVSKTKVSKKVPSNNFPSNVRSLLSTGMLDGVPVKYVAWSQEKELQGVIKGSGYLCSCQLCNFSKVINAYELERHAGCKTKHPNNHIYFENGKTVYGIVQELRSTPQNLLFDVIQTITGSPINQKSFRIWKESFLAATSELQRIYGKD